PHGLKPDGCSGEPSAVRLLPGRRRERRGGGAPADQGTLPPAPCALGARTPPAASGAHRGHRRAGYSPRTSARGTHHPSCGGTGPGVLPPLRAPARGAGSGTGRLAQATTRLTPAVQPAWLAAG